MANEIMSAPTGDQQLALKVRHEIRLMQELNAQYNDIINASTAQYEQNNTAFDVSIYLAIIAAIIASHYTKTSRTFTKVSNSMVENSNIMNQLQLIADNDITADSAQDILARINLATLDINLQNAIDYSKASASEINKTNIKQLAGIVALGLSIADFKSQLKITYKARVPMIAQTSVQEAAESTKYVNISQLNETMQNAIAAGGHPLSLTLKKTWNSKLDGRERPWHNEADGQTVKASEPFIVKNQFLRYPGDTSLGASPDNYIRCRCWFTLNSG